MDLKWKLLDLVLQLAFPGWSSLQNPDRKQLAECASDGG